MRQKKQFKPSTRNFSWWIDHQQNVVIASSRDTVVIDDVADIKNFYDTMGDIARWAPIMGKNLSATKKMMRERLAIAYYYHKEKGE